jgi:uncharacterized protein YggE
MKKLAPVLTLFLTSLAGFCQDRPTLPANSISAGADGKFEAAPDTAVIDFSISVQEENSHAAYEHASQQAEQVRQILRTNGVEPKNAQISSFSLQPVYDYKTPKRKLVGYRVNASVTVKLKDFAKIPSILQALADANVSDTQSLGYALEEMENAKNKAVEDAYRHARQSADAVARVSGRTLGELSSASVDIFENAPIIRPMSAQFKTMAAPVPSPTEEFTPQTISVTAHVNALFTLK